MRIRIATAAKAEGQRLHHRADVIPADFEWSSVGPPPWPGQVQGRTATRPPKPAKALLDEIRGEVVHAFVVRAERGVEPDADAAQASAGVFLKQKHGANTDPRRVTYLDSLPKIPSGKIRRTMLRHGVNSPWGNSQ